MNNAALCPDDQTLENLLRGLVSEDEAGRLEQHLLDCERCCQATGEIEVSDTLFDALRQVAAADDLPRDEIVQETTRRLKELRWPIATAIDDTIAAAGAVTEDAWNLERLLDPPEAEGELGRFAGYRVMRVLGAGGMGLVLEAEDPKLRRRVALKVMKRGLASRDEHHQRFLREARAAAAIEHPHIVTVYQVGEHGGLPFMVMPLLKGEALDERLRRAEDGLPSPASREDGLPSPSSKKNDGNIRDGLGRPSSARASLPFAECLRIGRETAEALAEAHQRGLIHRDIKPGNIWLEGAGGWVKLVDFGLAHAAEDVHLTQTGAILGTPAYMSPEQARGEAADGRTDLYSLGAVLYRLTTGDVPFRGASTLAVLMALATETPRSPSEINPEVPPALSDLIVRLLAKNPDDRFESATVVAEAIRDIEASRVGIAHHEPDSEPCPPRASTADAPAHRRPRWPLVAAAAAAAACFLLAGIVLIIHDKDGKEKARFPLDPGDSLHVSNDDRAAEPAKGAPPRSDTTKTPIATKPIVGTNRPDAAASLAPVFPWSVRGALPDAEKPFVLVRAGGQKREAFKHLTAAFIPRAKGDVIEIHGNGPFRVPPLRIDAKGLTLRAAEGYRPRLVPTEDVKPHDYWWRGGGPLAVEGCDIDCQRQVRWLKGNGESWTVARCRVMGRRGGLIAYGGGNGHGSGLRIADSLFLLGQASGLSSLLDLMPGAKVDFSDNIVSGAGIVLLTPQGAGGQKVRCSNNTFPFDLSGGIIALGHLADQAAPVELVFEGNLLTGVMLAERASDAKRKLQFRGKNNGYRRVWTHVSEDGKRLNEDPSLAAWNKLWGAEEPGSTESSDGRFLHVAYQNVERWPEEALIAAARKAVADARAAHPEQLAAVGPDLDLMGTGEAYLRALRAAGRLPADAELRPEALEGGPVVELREGKPPRGHWRLQDAVAAADQGEVTLEIRADELDGGVIESPRTDLKRLTIKAAPGYRPLVKGPKLEVKLNVELIVEGLVFRDALFGTYQHKGPTRLANCALEQPVGINAIASTNADMNLTAQADQPLEIVNCVFPGCIYLYPADASLATVSNSLIGPFTAIKAAGAARITFDRCLAIDAHAPWLGVVYPQQGASVSVAARDCLFFAKELVAQDDAGRLTWKGERNFYQLDGIHRWYRGAKGDDGDKGLAGLAGWREKWQSDADSLPGAPLTFSPAAWRLLPDSPGYRAGPEGRDLGADVDRVAADASAQEQ